VSARLAGSVPAPAPRRAAGARGFSFIEVLVVMGIIAVLAGIALVVMGIVQKKAPEFKTKTRLQKIAGTIEAFRLQTGVYPPTDIQKIKMTTGFPIQAGKLTNTVNAGIESLYQCLMLPGFDHKLDVSEAELGNTDEDKLDKPIAVSGSTELYELLDAWGNPFVYLVDADYAASFKEGVTYTLGSVSAEASGEPSVQVKAWKLSTGGYAQAGKFQLFSMGPDGLPNTDDDIKAWE
jgi:prepilin-type N-terminal cleavage/methylation domain-containing protein